MFHQDLHDSTTSVPPKLVGCRCRISSPCCAGQLIRTLIVTIDPHISDSENLVEPVHCRATVQNTDHPGTSSRPSCMAADTALLLLLCRAINTSVPPNWLAADTILLVWYVGQSTHLYHLIEWLQIPVLLLLFGRAIDTSVPPNWVAADTHLSPPVVRTINTSVPPNWVAADTHLSPPVVRTVTALAHLYKLGAGLQIHLLLLMLCKTINTSVPRNWLAADTILLLLCREMDTFVPPS